MTGNITHNIEYLRAPSKYFWQWADKGEVIEWMDGNTICYRDDLVELFRAFLCYKPPSISEILLLLSACNNNFNFGRSAGILAGIIQSAESYSREPVADAERDELQRLLDKAFEFLQIVSSLPADLKKGQARITLMQEVFAEGNFSISTAPLKSIADELDSGKIDQFVFKRIFAATTATIKSDLEHLCKARQKFNNANQLALRLKTGLAEIPEPITEEVVEVPETDLFAALLQDAETAGMARLAMQLVPVINIPMHVQGSSQMPVGGISDITNRGNYDKLLLSELAQDEDVLMARLVNNEALFLRREQPPENPKLRRTVLIDTTLKMWGIPRIFAVAAALAVAKNSKHHELLEAFTMAGKDYYNADISSKEGVIETLAMLDHSLHSGASLAKYMEAVKGEENNECFFITSASIIENTGFYPYFFAVKQGLSYVLTVSREGELKFYAYKNGSSKLLNTAKLDVDALLFSKNEEKSLNPLKPVKPVDSTMPLFYSHVPHPLNCPLTRVSKDNEKRFAYLGEALGIVGVSEVQRLLWFGKNKNYSGATELLDFIENGSYFFGFEQPGVLHVFVHAVGDLNILYTIDINTGYTHRMDNLPSKPVRDVLFLNNTFLISYWFEVLEVNYNNSSEARSMSVSAKEFYLRDKKPSNISYNKNTPNVPNYWQSESILFNVSQIHLDVDDNIVLGKHVLVFHHADHASLLNNTEPKKKAYKPAQHAGVENFPSNNPFLRYSKWVWKDGSEALLDSRGLLHLRSSDNAIPEITIVMVLAKSIACWASNGVVTGNNLFLQSDHAERMRPREFYNMFFKPFIRQLS